MGQAGVTKALEVIWKELDISMALCGVQQAVDLSREHLLVPEDFEGRWG
jgi:L-lactate dehydrogenase (cytochrome)